MHTHICHTFGAESKALYVYIWYAANWDAKTHANIPSILCQTNRRRNLNPRNSQVFIGCVSVYLSERKFSSLFILWFLLLFFLNCIYLKSGHFCKFALMFFQWKNKRILFCPSSKIKAFCKSKKKRLKNKMNELISFELDIVVGVTIIPYSLQQRKENWELQLRNNQHCVSIIIYLFGVGLWFVHCHRHRRRFNSPIFWVDVKIENEVIVTM